MAQDSPQNLKPFGMWLQEFRQDARQQGISSATLDDAFADAEPDERVIELDHKQPEGRLTLEEYLHNVVTPKRIKDGQRLYSENRAVLEAVGRQYGVQPKFIVALWGIETGYGGNTGGFSTIDSLMTLAYDGRRSDFFRDELIKALKILEQEHIAASELEGSWAGAMGQCQFMPTSFLQFAVDYNKDGHRDIWNSKPDVFASIANYLKSSGWDAKQGWGRRVTLPAKFDAALADIKLEKPLSQWDKLGVRTHDGKALPKGNSEVSLILVGEGDDAAPYIVYDNYKVLLKWNRSRYFATAVGTLADKIGK